MISIFNSYVTFLREINIKFQIVLINKKLNLQNIFKNKDREDQIYNKYLQDMKIKLVKDEIFYTDYYIIVSIEKSDSIEDIDKTIYILKDCGCDVRRVWGKEILKSILYECINKEQLNG